jgi:hypothetical protein
MELRSFLQTGRWGDPTDHKSGDDPGSAGHRLEFLATMGAESVATCSACTSTVNVGIKAHKSVRCSARSHKPRPR